MFFSYVIVSALACQTLMADEQAANIHLQSTVVSQEHGAFSSSYSGRNSLSSSYDNQTSITWTIYGGVRIGKNAEFYIDPELAGGSGFNKTTGMAGFPNGEIYRVDDPGPKWSLARLYLKQSFGFGGDQEQIKDDKNQLSGHTDVRRFTAIAGKFALNDFFDSNSYSHDPRIQFLNWALMDYGAWDYAADTKGYSWGLYLELNQPTWAVRFASVMVPLKANQMEMDKNFPAARGDNLEFEYRYSLSGRPGISRFLVYENHANMGNYRRTINTPAYNMDVAQSRSMSVKYGIGFNVEQALTSDLGSFFRAAWNDGVTESWAFTEVDRSLSIGLSLKGISWKRENDIMGFALIANALSNDHRDYVAAGGTGFIIGDGKIKYSPEEIGEIYYLWNLQPGLAVTGDFQFVENPAYNADRGPVSIASIRLHYEM